MGAHSEALPVSNIEVLALLKSFESRELVKATFNWRWYYYVLTEEGINYLRTYLAIPEDIVPETVAKAQNKSSPNRFSYEDKAKQQVPGGGFSPEYGSGGGDRKPRDGYRQRE